MPLSRAVHSEWPVYRAGSTRVVVVYAVALAACCGCAAADRTARQDVESLQTNVQQMESSLQARQAGVYEQIRDLREAQSKLERDLEDNGRLTKTTGQKIDRLREATQEEFATRDKSAQAATEQLSRLGARGDGLQKDLQNLQKGLQTLNDNLVAMSAFEKKQEERIARIQEQFQSQLKVVVEEVGQEYQELVRSVAALRTELETVRQESAATRQGLVDLRDTTQQIAERLAADHAQIQELARRQDVNRKPAPVRGVQHTVRTGETLTTIAARYGISVQALMEKNHISDANSIREGQKLAISEP